jgi:phosphoglycolate phosphatase-like HAD superfamily hydrolase
MKITDYNTIVFDCDGVVLDSNKIKTQAFFNAAISYGAIKAQELVNYHIERGGVSRYKKFEWFIERYGALPHTDLKKLLENYAEEVEKGLLSCKIANGLKEFRELTSNAKWLIVSGGAQHEIREIFHKRNIAKYYESGVFGSPDTKDEILKRELANGNISFPALFIGDSKYDFEAATNANLDFIFLTDWSEVVDKETWCNDNSIEMKSNLGEFLNV